MFKHGKNSYLKRIEELELLLEREKRENAVRETELKRFREQEQFQQKSFQEIKMAVELKLKELDDRAQEFEHEKKEKEFRLEAEKTQIRQRMKEEADFARSALQREVEEEKKRAGETIQEQVRSFHQAYGRRLSEILAQIALLTQVSIRMSDRFMVADHVDVQEMFASEMGELAPETAAPVSSSELETENGDAVTEQPDGSHEQDLSETETDSQNDKEQDTARSDGDKEKVEYVLSLLDRMNYEPDLSKS